MWSQQGNKLFANDASGASAQGTSIALSANGNTLAVGGPADNSNNGATWIWTRTSGVWSQQGNKLVGSASSGTSRQGYSVALSADGNTLAISGPGDDSSKGAIWFYRRTGSAWDQMGDKLTVADGSVLGFHIALSANSDTLVSSSLGKNIYSLTPSQTIFLPSLPDHTFASVALSASGNTLIVGNSSFDANNGITYVYTRPGLAYYLQNDGLQGIGGIGIIGQGYSVACSADGKTIAIGGPADNGFIGAVWVFI